MVVAPQTAAAATFRLAIVAFDYRFAGIPSTLPAGDYDIRFFNVSRAEPHEAVAFNLGPECADLSRADVIALLEAPEEEAAAQCPNLRFEGFVFAPPFGRDNGTFSLAPGRTMFVCFIPTPEGIPHFRLGMLSFTNVRDFGIG
ncbi:MAG: hypothetical protein M3144_05800 [Actinomycetota bacterium]|nr:hypothetical protein [Actinomycetota bacterium]